MRYIGVLAVLGLILAGAGTASAVSVITFQQGGPNDAVSGYGLWNGNNWEGELKAVVTGLPGYANGTVIKTFCAEKLENISYGSYNAVVNTQIITGTALPTGSEPLDAKTAWLYAGYLSGTLTVGNNAQGALFQEAIWAIQNDIPAPTLGSNIYYDAAMVSGASGLGNIRVLNLTDSNGGLAQDILVAVPEPVTMAGVFLGIGCLGGYLRKRRTA